MTTKVAKGTILPHEEQDFPLYFHEWVKRRRQELDLTQEQLAKRASQALACGASTAVTAGHSLAVMARPVFGAEAIGLQIAAIAVRLPPSPCV